MDGQEVRELVALGKEHYQRGEYSAAAGIFGTSKRAPRTGLAIGITYDWDAFTPVK